MDRPELGYLLTRALREVIAREEPLLGDAGLQMWDYVILGSLGGGDAPTQAQLAVATHRDKSRLIGNLDRLEERGFVRREADPADRRNRIVSLTDEGRRVLGICRAKIRAMEDDLLGGLQPADRAAFERVLIVLAGSGG